MRLFRGLALIATGIVSLAVIAVCWPLLAALRSDVRERTINDELARDRWGYDDNDPGVDVDGEGA